MSKLISKRITITGIVLVVATGAALWGSSTGKSAPASPSPVPIAGVSADTLSRAGITLEQPIGAAPNGSKASAASAAQQFAGGSAIRDEQFAHCVIPNAGVDRDCWAVSLNPADFQANGPATTTQATYLVVFVDPTSGNVLIGADGTP